MLILTGVLLLVDGGLTLLWQEPVTAAIALIKREGVSHQYLSYRTAPLTEVQAKAVRQIKSDRQRIAYLARADLARIKTGDAIGQIEIPKIGNTYNVVQGDQTAQLQLGPGHYPSTALPGMGQTVGIAGHRTTYLAPFRFINRLHHGDLIHVTMPYGGSRTSSSTSRSCRRPTCGSSTTSAMTGSCCRPATRSTRPRSGSSCSRSCARSSRSVPPAA